jgi:hypothetical protein
VQNNAPPPDLQNLRKPVMDSKKKHIGLEFGSPRLGENFHFPDEGGKTWQA